MKYGFLIALIFVFSCNSENGGKSARQPPHHTTANVDSLLVLQMLDSTSVIYEEDSMVLSFSYVDQNGRKNKIPMGRLHNTFGQPPHETKLISSSANKEEIFALVITNIVHLGVGSDYIHVFKLNKKSNLVTQVCNFGEIAVYADTSVIDSLEDIKLYDYEVKMGAGGIHKLILHEYEPYKFEDETKNKPHQYTKKTRECEF